MYIRRESTREERAQIFSRQKTQGTKRCGEGREMSLLCDPGSELRLGGSKKKKGDQNKWDGEKKQEKTRKKNGSDLPYSEKISIPFNSWVKA